MAKIRILPENLSNKIAAGEVVERPASVVKELMENSLDAGSRRIFIDVENGGRGHIQVADNGIGMSHDDALLSIERYATSKIIKDPDLFAIQTLGFRGEALPSIASVSHFSLTTRSSEAEAATQIDIVGGRIERVTEVGAPVGTLISIRRLFFNTPARRKFLKTTATEMGHIAETVSAMALGWPEVQVRLRHNNKTVKSWPKADPAQRVADVLGAGLQPDLLAVRGQQGDIGVSGWIGAPRITRSTHRGIYLFVNGRFVRDRVLQHAIFNGYAGRLVKGQYPVAVIWATLPYDEVDVNVHPTKHEVRFAHQKRVHAALSDAVGRALSGTERTRWYGDSYREPHRPVFTGVLEPAPHFSSNPAPADGPAENVVSSWNENKKERSRKSVFGAEEKFDAAPATAQAPEPPPDDTQRISASPERLPDSGEIPSPSNVGQHRLWEKRQFADLKVIGQLRDTYLICEGDDGLVLIDQHAAHERITYEKLKQGMADRKPVSQRLLLPETVEMGYREAQVLTQMIPELKRMGLELELFGGTTFMVTAVPDLLSQHQIGTLLRELVEKIVEVGFGDGLEKIVDQCLMVMACHGSIRANQSLAPQEIRGLLTQLDRCRQPSHCPHGRPTWIQWSLTAVEKAFNRIV